MVLRMVMKEPMTFDMWNALESNYQVKSLPNRFNLKQRIYRFKIEENKDLDKNLDVLTKILSNLSSLNVELEEEDQAVIVLNSLPKRFHSMVHTREYSRGKDTSEDTTPLKENLRSAYSLEMELKQRGDYMSKSSGEGLFVQARGRNEKRNFHKDKFNNRSKYRPKTKKVCRICGEEKHFKRECRKKN